MLQQKCVVKTHMYLWRQKDEISYAKCNKSFLILDVFNVFRCYNATRLWHFFRILMLRKTVYQTYAGKQSPVNKLVTKNLIFRAWVTELESDWSKRLFG